MNFVFWALIIIALVLIWFLLSFAFKGVGTIFLRLWNEAKQEMDDDEKDEKRERKEEHER